MYLYGSAYMFIYSISFVWSCSYGLLKQINDLNIIFLHNITSLRAYSTSYKGYTALTFSNGYVVLQLYTVTLRNKWNNTPTNFGGISVKRFPFHYSIKRFATNNTGTTFHVHAAKYKFPKLGKKIRHSWSEMADASETDLTTYKVSWQNAKQQEQMKMITALNGFITNNK